MDHLICTRSFWGGGVTTECYDPRTRKTVYRLVCPGATRHDVNSPRWREMDVSFIKKSLERAQKPQTNGKCSDHAFVKLLPAIAEFLTCTMMDGKERLTSTVSAWWTSAGFTAVLNDRESGQSLFVSSDTFGGLWEALEAALKSPDPGWRAKDDHGRSKRVKKT